jgi:hypothetical protein
MKFVTSRRRSGSFVRRAVSETLEPRTLLTANPPGVFADVPAQLGAISLGRVAAPTAGPQPAARPAVSPAAVAPFTPAQIRHFYGIDSIGLANGLAGTGAGQTIAIIDAYSQPNIVSDLATFDSAFGLPAPPSFTVEDENGGINLPSYNSGWAIEISLDVEWAHAIAPQANLLLIEAASNYGNDLIQTALDTANSTPGVSVVSMSFGFPDSPGENFYDPYFARPGITYLAAAGDQGSAETLYPSTSPNVISVGGTAITTSDGLGSYGSETVWNDSHGATGGAVSANEPKPSYQSSVTLSSSQRTVPDVSLEAAPGTGVNVLDTSQPNPGYYLVGGTSLSTPCWAGLVAIANQGRSLIGLSSLTGSTQTLPAIYGLPSADFNDITTGNNNFNNTGGYAAAAGCDLATGRGTPVAPQLVPDLVGLATVTGEVFQDNNANGIPDGTDSPLAGLTVFMDANSDGIREAGEPTAVTDAAGQFTFGNVSSEQTGSVRLLSIPAGFAQESAATYTTASDATSMVNVGLFPTTFTDSNPGDSDTVRVSPTDATRLQILVNGTLTYTAPLTIAPALSFTFGGSADALSLDLRYGNPVQSLSFNGSSASDGDTLTVLGSSGVDGFAVAGSIISYDSGSQISFASVPNLVIDPGTGTDSLSVIGAAVTVPAGPTGGGVLVRTLSLLQVGAAASVRFATAASPSDRTVAVVNNLQVSSAGTLDLGGNDMDASGISLSAVNALAAEGYANGHWTGPGITSSAAAADSMHLTALAVVQNNQSGSPLFNSTRLFDGVAPGAADILIKHTYVGDANLDGKVDGADYSLIDAGFASGGALTGWADGDFNYDGTVDATDYALIDNAFNNQRTALPSAQVAAAAASFSSRATHGSVRAIPASNLIRPAAVPARFVPAPPESVAFPALALPASIASALDLLDAAAPADELSR